MKFRVPTLSVFILLATAILLLFACKKDIIPENCPAHPQCPDYDPCWYTHTVNADFIIFDTFYMSYVPDFSLEVDTSWNGTAIHFRALHNNDTYEWKIGSDPNLRTGKEIYLIFGSNIVGDIPVRLVTTRETDHCTIERDTVIKSFHLLDVDYADLPFFGKFKGVKSTHPEDSIEIEIMVPDNPPGHPEAIFGLFDNCTSWALSTWSYPYFFFESREYQTNCEGPRGYGWTHGGGNVIEIQYTANLGMGLRSDTIRFLGRRIE